ncbi:MAG: hypothetical protein PF541_09545 [Prolixibacteraceae bacterium]|nr:hypothetical protein [Prolixibacteraceae bacterium]
MVKVNSVSLGVGSNAGFPIGIIVDKFISPHFLLEFGLGITAGGFGVNYNFTNPLERKFNYYSGFRLLYNYADNLPIFCLPVGISFLSDNNYQFSFESGLMYSDNISPKPSPMVGLKFGYRFGDMLREDYRYGKEVAILDRSDEILTNTKSTLSLSLGATTPFVGIVYERLLFPHLSIEAGIGLLSFGAGMKYYIHPLAYNKLAYHIGVSHYAFIMPWLGGWKTYFPIGVSLQKDKIRMSLDAGPSIWWYNGSIDMVMPGANLRIGKTF